MQGEKLKLENHEWIVGEPIGDGGMATVYAVTSGDQMGAAKFIPKDPGAERELLFVDVKARNVVPTVDRGEHDDFWVIVMPRADRSLRDLMEAGGVMPLDEATDVMDDILAALEDLANDVVHRDLKPENVLSFDGHWQIADFGISRYAEATTASDTRKHYITPPYAAPEQWRHERATPAADVYAFGVLSYELLAGKRPFPGPASEDYRDQHLHDAAPALEGVPVAIDALVAECLYKAAAARPSAANLAARLKAAATNVDGSTGLAQLASANREEVHRASVHAAAVSAAQTEAAQRRDLLIASQASWHRITTALQTAIEQVAPAAQITKQGSAMGCTLGQGRLTMTAPSPIEEPRRDVAFDVIAAASIDLTAQGNYTGRSHSVWFCDAVTKGEYSWFETAFMTNPVMRGHRPKEPFAMGPSDGAADALSPAMHSVQVAWPFTRLDIGDLGEFINRWGGWLALAATGQLQHPSSMPERQPAGSWRRS
jgi:hypothetical protein